MRAQAMGWVALAAVMLAGCQAAKTVKVAPEYEVITPAHTALVARAEAAMKAAENNPGREYANFLRTEPRPTWLSQMRGEVKAPKGSLGWPVREITGVIEGAEKGPGWPVPPEVRLPFAATAPKIDGKLDDEAWKGAATYTDVYQFNQKEKVAGPPTTWKAMWDEKFLYFAFDCVDVDLVAAVRERDTDVYADDCVEMFICPDLRFRTYWELIIAPSGSIYDSIQCKSWDTWGCHSKTSENIGGLQVGIQLRGTLNQPGDKDEGYTVEVAVPFAELPGYTRHPQAIAAETLNFMLVRLDRNGKEFKCYSYQPLLSWGHNLWNHARVLLVK